MTELKGKTALVTGASRGYGKAIAERLARDGAFVIVHYGTNAAAAAETVESIAAAGGAAVAVAGELDGSPAAVEELLAGVDKCLADADRPAAIDILVNNAAISPRGTIENTTEAIYDEVFAVNAKAPFFIVQQILSRMPDAGRIINISSQTSLIAFPDVAAYSMAKGALDLLTKVAAKHLAPRNITVNAVLPGVADTDMNASWLRGNSEAEKAASQFSAFNRIATVDDIADIVAFLSGPDARWLTGQLIDGGGGSRL